MTVFRVARAVFWEQVRAGSSMEAAAAAAGFSKEHGRGVLRQCGGMMPQHFMRPLSGRFLSPLERVTIAVAHSQKLSTRKIAALVGRSPSTVSRELSRNRLPSDKRYDARLAQFRSERRGLRPQPSKLAKNPVLHEWVQQRLNWRWSPEQISNVLRRDFPTQESMRVSHETIYRALFVQARGSLKRDLEVKLRTGRTLRQPRKQRASDGRVVNRISEMVMISERPAEAADRAVPGHWEGDLIVGTRNGSQIGTLVERSTRFVMLVHLPGTRGPDTVAAALIDTIRTMPAQLARSLTWDQGMELAGHRQITMATDMPIYFCDPRSPWQRGSNENTNGLLRQYFPKGTDLSTHTAEHLEFVARELNGRPRKTLDWKTPAQALDELLLAPQQKPGAATTT